MEHEANQAVSVCEVPSAHGLESRKALLGVIHGLADRLVGTFTPCDCCVPDTKAGAAMGAGYCWLEASRRYPEIYDLALAERFNATLNQDGDTVLLVHMGLKPGEPVFSKREMPAGEWRPTFGGMT